MADGVWNPMPKEIPALLGTLANDEWLEVSTAVQRHPFSRSSLYELIREGKIKTALIRKRGNSKGKRLVSNLSILRFIESHASGGSY